jgi:putative DNA primase/helicase
MEGAAIMCNDSLLALDEINQCEQQHVGEIIYMLGNGMGKQRANLTGAARNIACWRCFVLSSGEFTIGTIIEEGGNRVKAGQTMRLLDLPAMQPFGSFNDLHGAQNGSAFADHLKQSAEKFHGHAGRAFLERLTRDQTDYCAKLEQFKSLPMFTSDEIGGQTNRAAGRFVLIGLAGEVATEYGLTGWPEGAAIAAAEVCFNLWKANRGKGNDERRQILEQVSTFIDRHGDGRFSNADSDSESKSEIPFRDRAGWWQDTHEGRIYLFTPGGFREATKGFEIKRTLDVLQDVGAIPPCQSNGERAKLKRIDGRTKKLYHVNPEKLMEGLKNGD